MHWSSKTVARTVAARKVTAHDPRNKLKMKEFTPHRLESLRPVTSEVAGSSPVVPATFFNHFHTLQASDFGVYSPRADDQIRRGLEESDNLARQVSDPDFRRKLAHLKRAS